MRMWSDGLVHEAVLRPLWACSTCCDLKLRWESRSNVTVSRIANSVERGSLLDDTSHVLFNLFVRDRQELLATTPKIPRCMHGVRQIVWIVARLAGLIALWTERVYERLQNSVELIGGELFVSTPIANAFDYDVPHVHHVHLFAQMVESWARWARDALALCGLTHHDWSI